MRASGWESLVWSKTDSLKGIKARSLSALTFQESPPHITTLKVGMVGASRAAATEDPWLGVVAEGWVGGEGESWLSGESSPPGGGEGDKGVEDRLPEEGGGDLRSGLLLR